jgi:hypothetical protein
MRATAVDPTEFAQQRRRRLLRAGPSTRGWPGRAQIEVLKRTLDHALRREDFGRADRSRCFDIDDDRVVDIDQLVVE